MSSSRKRRRRLERERAKRPGRSRSLNPVARIGLVGGGLALVVVGVALLAHGDPSNQARLGRLAGILILLGLVGVGAGAIGRI